MSEDQIAQALQRDLEAAADMPEIEVLECNQPAVNVFLRCEPALVMGMGGALYTGLPSAEVVTVMQLLRVPREQRVELFDAVKAMGHIWAAARNEMKG